jgi:predicted 2-oxoglutarate/Fe(II)-dependent dioxygenase YbiX
MFVKIYENVFSEEECKNIINLVAINHKLDFITTYNTITKQNSINFDFNKRKGIKFQDINGEYKFVKEKLLNIANGENLYANVIYNEIDEYLFNQYEETDYLNYHIDSNEIMFGATITILVQLNDDYEGGEFCYIIEGKETQIKPKIGSVIIFESNIQHKIKTILKGARYSFNVWPKIKKIKTNLM